MISLIKGIIWLVGFVVVFVFVLNFFGYEINRSYFSDSKEKCQEKLEECAKNYVEEGTKNAKCDFDCVDPKLIIRKK